MRKINPADVIDDFKSQLDDLLSYFDRIAAAIAGTQTEQSDLSLLAEQTFVSAAVAMEGFFSDFMVGCVNRDSSAVVADFQARFKTSVKEKFGAWLEGHSSISIPQHPKVEAVQSLLNPKGRNITFEDAGDLKEKAARWITGQPKIKIAAFTVHDDRLINAVKAVRDFIAHRSSSAKSRMNGTLSSIGTGASPNAPLRRGVKEIHDVGSYLKSVVALPNRRIHTFFERMKTVAESLR